MVSSKAVNVLVEELIACEIGRDVTAKAGGSWRWRMGVGVMWGIGASLEVEDEGGVEMPVSGFKGCVSILGVANGFVCKAKLLVFDLSAGDAEFVYKVGDERIGDCEEGDFSGMSGGVNASSLESNVGSGDFEGEGCKPPSPLASADNRSPSPADVLRYRAVELSASAVTRGGFDGSEARGGMAEFSPTS
jgi:hypothetical protein